MKKIDLSADGDWLKQNQKKPSFKHIVEQYKKITGKNHPDLFEVLYWYKKTNHIKKLTSSVVSRFIEAALESDRKVWTKPEWEAYKKQHPATAIKPKFNNEGANTKKEEVLPQSIKNKVPTNNIHKQLEILKKTINPDKKLKNTDKEDNQTKFIKNITNFTIHPKAGQELAKTFDTLFKSDYNGDTSDFDTEKLSSHILTSLKNISNDLSSPNKVIRHVLNYKSENGTSLLDMNEFQEGGDFITKVISGLVQNNLFSHDKYTPLENDHPNDYYDLKTPNFDESKLSQINQPEVKKASYDLKTTLESKFNNETLQSSKQAKKLRKTITNQFDGLLSSDDKFVIGGFETEINHFTGYGFDSNNAGLLSKKVQQVYGLEDQGPDWRQKKKLRLGDDPYITEVTKTLQLPDDEKNAIKLSIKKEQEILKQSGLVDDDGYLTVFRVTNHLDSDIPKGEQIDVGGNYVDSWALTVNPRFHGTVLRAKVHISQVVSSCVGKGDEFPFKESEVVLMGKSVIATTRGKIESMESKLDDEDYDPSFNEYDLTESEGDYFNELQSRLKGMAPNKKLNIKPKLKTFPKKEKVEETSDDQEEDEEYEPSPEELKEFEDNNDFNEDDDYVDKIEQSTDDIHRDYGDDAANYIKFSLDAAKKTGDKKSKEKYEHILDVYTHKYGDKESDDKKTAHIKNIVSSVANKYLYAQLESDKRIWTKEEWESYKKKHPATGIKPKFSIDKPTTETDTSNQSPKQENKVDHLEEKAGLLKELTKKDEGDYQSQLKSRFKGLKTNPKSDEYNPSDEDLKEFEGMADEITDGYGEEAEDYLNFAKELAGLLGDVEKSSKFDKVDKVFKKKKEKKNKETTPEKQDIVKDSIKKEVEKQTSKYITPPDKTTNYEKSPYKTTGKGRATKINSNSVTVGKEDPVKIIYPENYEKNIVDIKSVKEPEGLKGKHSAGIVATLPAGTKFQHDKSGTETTYKYPSIMLAYPLNEFGGDKITFPKGGVDTHLGEKTIDAAVREAYEESGVQTAPHTYLGDYTNIDGYYKQDQRMYVGEITGGDSSKFKDDETDSVGYFELHPNYKDEYWYQGMKPHDKSIIDDAYKHLKLK